MVDRPELGALLTGVVRKVIAGEEPILARHDLQMWDHVVLTALADGPTPTQAELAATTGRDKTRLIRNLDRLQARGLVRRTPDPSDRRNKVVELTAAGHRTLESCRAEITAMEDDLLSALPRADRRAFERALMELATPAEPNRSASNSED